MADIKAASDTFSLATILVSSSIQGTSSSNSLNASLIFWIITRACTAIHPISVTASVQEFTKLLQYGGRDSILLASSSKCPPSARTHAGWSHLIRHNFVKVAGN